MRFIAKGLCRPFYLAVLCSLLPVSYSFAADGDIALANAKYVFSTQQANKALLILNRAEISDPVSDNAERLALKAEVLVSLGRYDEANALFEQLLQGSRGAELMQQIAFPLAELNFEKGDCPATLKFLARNEGRTVRLRQQAFYMRSSCLAQQEKADMAAIEAMAAKLDEFTRANKKSLTIWLAYSYYNLAVAALNNRQLVLATEYFSITNKYLDGSTESQAMREKVLLTQANANYANNQYDVALGQFAKLDINGYWKDQSLLGFGWSAFYNYNRGLALEAWRQLVFLPNKSMSVYEGMLAIPFALEKSNAFARALKSYDAAITEYDAALEQISALERALTIDKIRAHALEYINQKDELVEPLHPLLGATYTQPFFRTAVERVGIVAAQRQRLEAYKKRLSVFAEVADWTSGAKNSQQRNAEQRLEVKLQHYFEKIEALSDQLLAASFSSEELADETGLALRGQYRRYLRLQSLAASGASSEQLAQLQHIRAALIWKSYALGYLSSEQLTVAKELIALHRRLEARLAGYHETVARGEQGTLNARPDDSDLQALIARIDDAITKNLQVGNQAEVYLQEITLGALADFREEIQGYQRQARIANARLREEFYQLGGRRL